MICTSIDETLKEDIDRLMKMVKSDNLDFYNKHFAARIIKDISGSYSKPDKRNDSSTTPTEPAGV
jgi:hypothetical protein